MADEIRREESGEIGVEESRVSLVKRKNTQTFRIGVIDKFQFLTDAGYMYYVGHLFQKCVFTLVVE